MSEHSLRSKIVDVTKRLYDRGHNAPGDGNVSARLSERYLLCTPTQCHKGMLAPRDIVKVRFPEGTGVDGSPSSEIRMHLAIYGARSDVHAIVHAHSPHAVGLTVAGESLAQPVVPEAIQLLGACPTVPYASPTTEDVAAAVLPFVLRYNAFILERHGPVTLGRDLEHAFSLLEVIEHTARITVVAMSAGTAAPIDAAEAEKLRQLAIAAGVLRRPEVDHPERIRPDERKLVDALTARVLERFR